MALVIISGYVLPGQVPVWTACGIATAEELAVLGMVTAEEHAVLGMETVEEHAVLGMATAEEHAMLAFATSGVILGAKHVRPE
jgi:hypothetical protein